MDHGTKRKAEVGDDESRDKRVKQEKKQWHVPRKNDRGAVHAKVIQPGDSGIWATCNKGREGKCVGELRDLFMDYAERLYGAQLEEGGDDAANAATDIESEINAEVAGIRKPSSVQLFTPVRLDVQCVIFFKTAAPVEPVSFVKAICEDAVNKSGIKRTRFAKRLSPMTMMGKATTEGLEKAAMEALAPHFHEEPFVARKFAIRPTLRNHNNPLTRDNVIRQIASLVGSGHTVDLKSYDLLVVVEVYQNVCGVSVVDSDFEKLKRFNLAEIFEPTLKQVIQEAESTVTEPFEDNNLIKEETEVAIQASPPSTSTMDTT